MKKRKIGFLVAALAGAALFSASPAWSLSMFTAPLTPLNDSGVAGQAWFTLDQWDLTVRVEASGLEPDQPHPMHIHGRFDDNNAPRDSVLPTMELDADGDGFLEVAEGVPAYGPIILPLTSPPGGALEDFPTAPDGMIAFEETYNLRDDSVFADDFIALDLVPLMFREIVLHGMTVGEGAGEGTEGEVDGTGGYKATLPVAAGEIVGVAPDGGGAQPVPEPGTLLLMGAGLIGSLWSARKRCQDH